MEKSLQDVLPNDWGTHQPKKFRQLLDAEYETLDQCARDIRAQLMDVIHGFERLPIITPSVCREQLEKRLLPRRSLKWEVVALNANREKIYTNKNNNKGEQGLRLVTVPTWDKFPTVDSANKFAKLPKNGVYLAIYTGSPEILADAKTFANFSNFATKLPITDVVIWDDTQGVAKFYSIAALSGAIGNDEIIFPDSDVALKWKELLC